MNNQIQPRAKDFSNCYLATHYTLLQKSMDEIANENCTSRYIVSKALDQHNIGKRRPGWRNDTKPSLLPEAYSIIDGQLLSDGYIKQHHQGYHYLTVSSKYYKYMEWLCQELSYWGLDGSVRGPRKRTIRRNSKIHTSWTSDYDSTMCMQMGTQRNRWYPYDKKEIPEDLVLRPKTCLHWYLGDGSPRSSSKRNLKGVYLYTNGFSDDEVSFLCELLKSEIGGDFTIHRNRGQPIIYITAKSHSNFFSYIGACPEGLIDIYGYKWPDIT